MTEKIPGQELMPVQNAGLLPSFVSDGDYPALPAPKSAKEAIEDYFGAKISNANTRAAYVRDAQEFGRWMTRQGLSLDQVRTLHVAGFRDQLKSGGNSAATVKRKISALRKMLSYLVETGALPYNPAREVTTEPVRRVTGKTPALSTEQMRTLFESFDTTRPIELRDRAFIGVMAYTFARVSAVCSLRGQDYIDLGRECFLRLHEKGGVERDIPIHPKLAEYLDEWRSVAKTSGSGLMFPSFERKGSVLTDRPLSRVDAFSMVKRRLKNAGLPAAFSNHSFRATGITQFLDNGGSLETAQQIANHADSRTTKLYDRRATRLELSEIARIKY
jgi:site-specific recombinase XerD